MIIRAVGGFYDVKTADGEEYRCRARGRLKKTNTGIYVGDYVRFTRLSDQEGVLEEIEPRRTHLLRPQVSNVDQVIIVCAPQNPPLSLQLLDRLLVLAEAQQLRSVICVNKEDLRLDDLADFHHLYSSLAGYTVLFTSAKYNQGIDQLRQELNERVSVLAGPSGVGKSSLLNRLQPGLELRTAAVSEKSKQGRHTTRHVELLSLDSGGLIADSPGFSQLELIGISSNNLAFYFPEFFQYIVDCRFTSCTHQGEPACAVREAVGAGKLTHSRYDNYLFFLHEIKQQERSY
ncbi:MAG TPA: ribosome small subunit-dependent GTPase A [Oscillospiraceae bacterium]|nr:ribosome small subunit-dependent GTPase A [Oscillospiraceae bacterium]